MTPNEYCQKKSAASGSSFYYSFLFLPPNRRSAITALYAFCREVDDIVDDTADAGTDLDIARTKLQWWRGEIAAMDAGQASHPVTRALTEARHEFALDSPRLLEIIDGMQMDLEQNRYADISALRLYCHRVASVVGTLASELFGASEASLHTDQIDARRRYAEHLGQALQLTNIIRDVGEDARRGRIYLPIEDLQTFHVPAQDILGSRYSKQFSELMGFQAKRAQQSYVNAMNEFNQLSPSERKAQRPGLIMGQIYATLLEEISRDNFQVLHQRTSLTPLRKLWLAWRTWVTGKLRTPRLASD